MDLVPIVRRSVRLLAAVHELHKQGYQDLAIYAGMSSSGFYWRCLLVPFRSVLYESGKPTVIADHEVEEAKHSSADLGNLYFGWDDAQYDNARDLAEKIKRRFPKLLEKSHRPNYRYAGWFTEMLGLAEQGNLPVMFDDSIELPESDHIKSTGENRIPQPPYEALWRFNNKKFAYVESPHLKGHKHWHDAYRIIIDNWRCSNIAYLPKYPIETNDIYEIGAYWEGAIYYIQKILGFSRIDKFLEGLANPDIESERWHTFHKVWNDSGQLILLKAFLIRQMLNEKNKYELTGDERDHYNQWLSYFEEVHILYQFGESIPYPPNPYFGGNNPLHLGLILSDINGEKLVNT
jgi:hypothetical protein